MQQTALSRRPTRFEWVILSVITVAGLYQLVVPPSIGMADNGDFPRIISRFHLDHVSAAYEDRFFYFFNAKYRFDPKQQWKSGFLSSTTLLVMLAIPINRLVSEDGLFDIRIIGLLYLAIALMAAWLLLIWSRVLSPPGRSLCRAMLVLALTDVGYVAYFNSFYSEPTGLVFLLVALAPALLVIQRNEAAHPAWLLPYFGAAFLFAAAKPQYALPGVLLAVFSLRLLFLQTNRLWRGTCGAGAIGLLVCAGASYRLAPESISGTTYYVSVFSEMLKHSPDPRADLVDLGLSPDLAKYAGTHPYQPGAPTADPEFQRTFFDHMSFGRLASFYFRHPGRLVASLDRSAAFALLLRPKTLGNFEKSAGLIGGAQSRAFSHWSTLHRLIAPQRLWSLTLFFGLNLAVAAWLYWKSEGGRQLALELYGVLVLMAISQYGMVSVLQGTIDPMKHMFLFCALFDICLTVSLVWLAGLGAAAAPAVAGIVRGRSGRSGRKRGGSRLY
ncbi:MAG: hypothetical protein ACKV22_36655 [Bryobacteraceae bacterium]